MCLVDTMGVVGHARRRRLRRCRWNCNNTIQLHGKYNPSSDIITQLVCIRAGQLEKISMWFDIESRRALARAHILALIPNNRNTVITEDSTPWERRRSPTSKTFCFHNGLSCQIGNFMSTGVL